MYTYLFDRGNAASVFEFEQTGTAEMYRRSGLEISQEEGMRYDTSQCQYSCHGVANGCAGTNIASCGAALGRCEHKSHDL